MELLSNANIDFLYIDVTNGFSYIDNALKVMKICHERNVQGYDAPQVVFYTHYQLGRGHVRAVYSHLQQESV